MSESEVPVTWEDQQKINQFGVLNSRVMRLKSTLAAQKKEYDIIADQLNEWILLDEDDPDCVKFRIGETYINVTKDDAEKRLTDYQSSLDNRMSQLSTDIRRYQDDMKALKITLYAKFRDQINLEDEASD